MMVKLPSGQGKRPYRRPLAGSREALMVSAALMVALVSLAGCGRPTTLAGSSRPHAPVTPTSPILPGAHLSWTAGSLMAGVSVAPSDGNIAYSCMQPPSTAVGPAVWVTLDRAQQWKQLAPLPKGTRQFQICNLILDAADSSIVVASVSWARPQDLMGAPPQIAITEFTQYITFDGGAHWQLLGSPVPSLLKWLATYHGTTVALLQSSDGSTHLWASTDKMRTWHELPRAPFGALGQPLGTLLINPATGDLLVLGNYSSNQGHIYESRDLGQDWSSLPMPLNSGAMTPLASMSVGSEPWRICGIAGTVSLSSFRAGTLICSMDSGQNWTSPPPLITTFDNTDKDLLVPQAADVVAVGADGTIYADMPSSMWPQDIPGGLYQLTPQATRWQPLTSPPGGAVYTTDIPGSGILWAMPNELGPGLAGPFPAAP